MRWTLAQPETAGQLRQEKQDRKNNTYYNNMIMYINNKQGDNDSTVSGIKVSVIREERMCWAMRRSDDEWLVMSSEC